MLTKTDLDKIREIIREEVGNETHVIRDELQADINMVQLRVRSNIEELKDRKKISRYVSPKCIRN